MNYGELKTAVAQWLDRTDLTSMIPTFIQMAEAKFFRVLRCPGNEQWATYRASSLITQTFQIPNDYLECKILMYGDKPLQRITDIAYLQKNAASVASGVPRYFARLKDQLYLYPQASYEDDVNLIYWETQGPMVNDTDATRTLMHAPDLYLYGALLEAQSYLIGDERLPVWQQKFAEILSTINKNAMDDEVGGSTMSVNAVYGD